MRSTEHYESETIQVGPKASACEIADEMDAHGIGCVIVTEDAKPLGIVTDRDLLCRVVAAGRDGKKTPAYDIMSRNLVTAGSDEPLQKLCERMQQHGIRRLPVVREGKLTGIVALDDIIAELGSELADLRGAVRTEVLEARRLAGSRRRRERIETAVEEIRDELSRIGSQTRGWIQQELDGIRQRFGRGS